MKSPTLTEILADLRSKIGEPYASLNDAVIKRIVESETATRALKVGDACPDFALMNAEGQLVRLQDLLQHGPLVLSFYRGMWCPFCSAELEALHEAEPRIKAAGATLVAISPEARGVPLQVKRERNIVFDRGAWCPYCTLVLSELGRLAPALQAAGATVVAVTPEVGGGAARIKAQCAIDFDVLSDVDNVLGMECGLVFPVPDKIRRAYIDIGIDLERINGNDMWLLPAPATFVVAKDATVRRSFVDIDFRYRVEPAEILKAVQALR